MFKNRKYKSGMSWAFWRWMDVPDVDHIARLHIIQTPLFSVCLHWLYKPDPDPFLHDHPVDFWSFVLKGWYLEVRRRIGENKPDLRMVRWFNHIKASRDDRHTIIDLEPGTITLCFMSRRKRDWGFHTPSGWEHWKAYYDKKKMLTQKYSAMDRNPFTDAPCRINEYLKDKNNGDAS